MLQNTRSLNNRHEHFTAFFFKRSKPSVICSDLFALNPYHTLPEFWKEDEGQINIILMYYI